MRSKFRLCHVGCIYKKDVEGYMWNLMTQRQEVQSKKDSEGYLWNLMTQRLKFSLNWVS